MSTVVVIIQARMGSTRLPGKVLRLLHGEPLLSHLIKRAKMASEASAVLVATSEKTEDDAIAALGASLGVDVYRGSEQDVLDRYYRAAQNAGADVVVRVTGDCPMHNGAAIDEVVKHFIASGVDYTLGPADVPEGLDTEVFTFAALERAWREAVLPSEREHVTLYIRNHPELFRIAPPWTVGTEDNSSIHLSVDTPEDFAFAEQVFAALGETFSTADVLSLLRTQPQLRDLNAGNTGFEGLDRSLKQDELFKRMNRLVLGTVELGMPYGLDVEIPPPTKEEAYAILDEAFGAGIRTFDTASAYGDAEELLGSWVASRDLKKTVNLISKGGGQVDAQRSYEHLGMPLEGYLLHTPQDIYNDDAVRDLRALKKQGIARRVGVSVYDEPEAVEAQAQGLDMVQVPYNALDRRFGKLSGLAVFARSPFLQGLLLLDPAALPEKLVPAEPYIASFAATARKFGLSQLEAALLFSLHSRPDYQIVFGVKTLAQLREILTAVTVPLPEGFVDAIIALPEAPAEVVNPTLWK